MSTDNCSIQRNHLLYIIMIYNSIKVLLKKKKKKREEKNNNEINPFIMNEKKNDKTYIITEV